MIKTDAVLWAKHASEQGTVDLFPRGGKVVVSGLDKSGAEVAGEVTFVPMAGKAPGLKAAEGKEIWNKIPVKSQVDIEVL